jgi:hypothetical protein
MTAMSAMTRDVGDLLILPLTAGGTGVQLPPFLVTKDDSLHSSVSTVITDS